MAIEQNRYMKFLKGLGMGIVYMLISPFILAGAVLYMIYGLCRWFILVPIGMIRFFKGDKFFKPLEEDLEVEAAKKAHHDSLVAKELESQKPAPQPVQNNATTYVQNNYYSAPNQQPSNPALNNFDNYQQLNPQTNPQLNVPNNQQIEAPGYQELPDAEYKQIPAQPAFDFDDDTYNESSIDNPINVPDEGGEDK